MKKFSKRLSLLLAGMLLTATLLACNDGGWTGDEEDEDDDDEKQSQSFDQYKGLSPEEVWDALLKADEYSFRTTTRMEQSGELYQEVIYDLQKDGNKLKYQIDGTVANEESFSRLSYCDLKKNYVYQQEGDEWMVEVEEVELENVFDIIPKDLLFDEDNYDEYDSTARTYPLLPEAIADAAGYEEDLTCSGSMTHKGTTYTFVISLELEERTQKVEVVIEFKSVSVKLPKADLPEENKPGETTAPGKEEEVPRPSVTDKPDEPYEPETNGQIDYYEVLDLLKNETSCELFIEAEASDGSIKKQLHLKKAGDILLAYNFDEPVYMDLSSGLLYTSEQIKDDYYWVYEASDSVIEWNELLDDLFADELSCFWDESNYTYEFDEMSYDYKLVIKDSVRDDLFKTYGIEVQSLYATLNIYDQYVYVLTQYLAEEDITLETYITISMDDCKLRLPEEAMSRAEYEQFKKEEEEKEEEPPFDSTPYVDLNPGELYNAMLNTPELYFFIEVNRDQVKLEKSGDIIAVDYYYAATETLESYYIDLSAQIRYRWGGGQEEFTHSWEEFLAELGIDGTNPFLNDQYYYEFDDSTTMLEIDPNALSYNIRSAALQRSGAYYHYDETISASKYTKISINFTDTDTELPY